MMASDLRGELTSTVASTSSANLIDAVAQSLQITSPADITQLGTTLFPALVSAAVLSSDIDQLDALKQVGACLAQPNADQRTPLHIACAEGNVDVAGHLMLAGVSVHARDRHQRTPLTEAIASDNHVLIGMLRQCGAHLRDMGAPELIGEQLCAVAAGGVVRRMDSWRRAGARLGQPDACGRTALHVAALHGHTEMVGYLLCAPGVSANAEDLLGMTALCYAWQRECNESIVEMLNARTTVAGCGRSKQTHTTTACRCNEVDYGDEED